MLRHSRRFVTLAVLALGLGAPTPPTPQIGYALANSGGTLISFNLATPGAVTTIGNLSGQVTTLSDIDFRVSTNAALNGILYGYNVPTNQIVSVNTTTGVTTFVASPSARIAGGNIAAIDFNPMADRLRIVSPNDQNLRVNLAGGATNSDGTLNYVGTDVNAGQNPNIRDVAYSNNVGGATSTTIYYIDSNLNTLVTALSPNSGSLTTIGALGVDPSNFSGFDIYTASLSLGGLNSAYAIIDTPAGANGLYSINLGTGAASLIGGVGASNINGFAIDPNSVAVPEPGSVALLVGLFVTGAGFVRKRRSRS